MPPRLARIAARILVATLALAACGSLPHPFEDDRPPPGAPILTVPDTVGIVVPPVSGTPDATGKALADAMVAALQGLEIPATTGVGNKHSYRLAGTAGTPQDSGATTRLQIDWVLTDSDGKEVGRDRQQVAVPTPQWAGGTGFADLARSEAPHVGGFIQDTPPVEHKRARQVFVRQVEGAPGDGRNALPSALAYALKRRGLALALDPQAPDTITVAGTVKIDPVKPDQEHVQIVWHILKPDGTDIGQVSQENTVPHGTLDGKWGEIAMAVALAGLDDIIKVVNAAPPA